MAHDNGKYRDAEQTKAVCQIASAESHESVHKHAMY